VIQPVETTPGAAASPKASADTTFATTEFADLHAAAVAREKTSAKASPKTASTATGGATPASERIAAPEGETWEFTNPGAHYAKIVSGPRKGEFINLTHGARRGETCTIEQRSGKTVHVYTLSGKVVAVNPSKDAADITPAARHEKHPPGDHPHAGERWAPVKGAFNYADILGGARNGLYVNTSGGVRDGMAFQIVKKGGKWFHVYGTGKDRQWIPSDGPKHRAAGAQTGASTGASTGGTAPASSA